MKNATKTQIKMINNLQLIRIKRDISGNPRYLIQGEDLKKLLCIKKPFDIYTIISKILGGRKYKSNLIVNNDLIIFQSHNTREDLKQAIYNYNTIND